MSDNGLSSSRVRFGPFVADLQTGELTKHGVRVRLPEQPFRLLALLLESPGELVTRERMREELWPVDTFVEFDSGLNSAVRRLRRALGDSSQSPRYVETLPKRGYRFIANAEAVVEPPAEPVPTAPEDVSEPVPAPPERSRGVRGLWRLAFITTLAALITGAVFLRDLRSPAVQAGPRRLEVKPLDNFPDDAFHPALSPDGLTLAYVARGDGGNRDIFIQRLNSSEPFRLTTDPAADLYPAWSPDGFQITFARIPPATTWGQYIASLSTGVATMVGLPARGGADWTADGRALVGVALGPSDTLALLPLETREEVPLVEATLETFDQHSAVSPDRETLAFARCIHPSSCDIYLQRLEGGEARRLTFQHGRIEGLTWVPGSDEIIYALDRRLYSVRAFGAQPPASLEFGSVDLRYGKSSSPTMAPVESSGAIRMVFAYRLVDVDIWITEVAESSKQDIELRRRKLIDSPGLDWNARFSPDGEQIAFISDRTGEPAIWVGDRDGGRQRQVTPTTLQVSADSPPAWSPDGRTLAFRASTQEAPVNHIYTIPAEGGTPRAITMGKDESGPQWSRDGLWVYHNSRDSGRPEIWMAPSDGTSPAIQITDDLAGAFVESPDGQFLYYSGDDPGAPGRSLMRIPAKGGGKAERMRERFAYATMQFVGADIYYLPRPRPEERDDGVPLSRFDPETGRDVEVSRIINPWGARRFSLSPDGRLLLTDHNESFVSKLMLVEDFR